MAQFAALVPLACFALISGCYLSHRPGDVDGGVQRDAQIDGAIVDGSILEGDAAIDGGFRWDEDAPGRDAGPRPDAAVPMTVACRGSIPIPSPSGVVPCERGGEGDDDGDGFANPIDCNDCFAQINPGALDIAGNAIDEDCSGADATGTPDLVASLDATNPEAAACAAGVCRAAAGRSWGLVSARWTTADGRRLPPPNTHRIADRFGTYRPTEGGRMVVLSTGGTEAGGVDGGSVAYVDAGPFPPGFPVASPACPGVLSGSPYDSVALELELRVPTNAIGLHFTSNFMTREYPEFLCSQYNDVYAVFLDDGEGLRNIVFDSVGNPVTVNNALLRTCAPGGPARCELGDAPLRGALAPEDTSFGVGGGTDCISTVIAIRGGSTITLRFAIWDSGDGVLDSVVLIDSLGFLLAPFGS